MNILKNVEFLRKVHASMLETYNRECRRVAALVTGGRDLSDERHHKLRDFIEDWRLAVEHSKRNLDSAIEAAKAGQA